MFLKIHTVLFVLFAFFAKVEAMKLEEYKAMVKDPRIGKVVEKQLEDLLGIIAEYTQEVEEYYSDYKEKNPGKDLLSEGFEAHFKPILCVRYRCDDEYARNAGYLEPINSEFVKRALALVFLGISNKPIDPANNEAATHLDKLRDHRYAESDLLSKHRIEDASREDQKALESARLFAEAQSEQEGFYPELVKVLNESLSKGDVFRNLLGDLDIYKSIDWDSPDKREEQLSRLYSNRRWSKEIYDISSKHFKKILKHMQGSIIGIFCPVISSQPMHVDTATTYDDASKEGVS